MGYINSATTTTLTAKLTPIGRKKIVEGDANLITSFSLGDSDANYNSTFELSSGNVPTAGGGMGPNNSLTNSVGYNNSLKSALILNNTGAILKQVEVSSHDIILETQKNGQVVLDYTNVRQEIIDRTNQNTDQLVNLFYSFGLPTTESEKLQYTTLDVSLGGFANTALSGLVSDKILVIAIDNTQYGETIDGKLLSILLNTSSGDVNIYSTFENKGLSTLSEDMNYIETSDLSKQFGNNVAFLFSDSIKTPNGGNGGLSWGTGFGTTRPFTNNGKQLFNMVTDSNVSEYADEAVGIAYLDKGLIVITHPDIVDNFDSMTNGILTEVTLDSISTAVSQNITCIANRGEFGTSTNRTFSSNDTPRVSEVALYDATGDMIALAKTDRHILKSANQFLALSVNITL